MINNRLKKFSAFLLLCSGQKGQPVSWDKTMQHTDQKRRDELFCHSYKDNFQKRKAPPKRGFSLFVFLFRETWLLQSTYPTDLQRFLHLLLSLRQFSPQSNLSSLRCYSHPRLSYAFPWRDLHLKVISRLQ